MLYEEKRDCGTISVCSKPRGAVVLSFVCIQVIHEGIKIVTVSHSLGYQTL